MKTVFSNSHDVMHAFAQRDQSEGHCSNVFFETNRIYSYGHHYLLAEFIANKVGEQAIMINNKGYSKTTAKHISEVRGATQQYKQFFTTETDPVLVLSELKSLAHKLQSARKKELYILPAERLYNKYQEFIQWNGMHNDLASDTEINALMLVFRGDSYSEYFTKQAERIAADLKKKQEEQKKRQKVALKKFFAYEINSVYLPMEEDFCRLSQDLQFVETTQNVRVPVAAAKVLYQLIKAGKDIKGFNLNGYTVIGLNGVLRIDCHKINKKNMRQIGEKIL